MSGVRPRAVGDVQAGNQQHDAKLFGVKRAVGRPVDSNLKRIRLRGVDPRGTDLPEANLDQVEPGGAELGGASLRKSGLYRVLVTSEQPDRAESFKGATLSHGIQSGGKAEEVSQ